MMTKALTPADNFKSALETPIIKSQLESAMGEGSKVFAASLIDAYVGGLQQYDTYNIIEEAMKAAVLNLPIAKSLGFAYLVPYKGKIQFQIGYKGLIQLAERSGQVKRINDGVIYEGELVEADKMRGLFDFTGAKQGDKVVGYFAYLELINGFEKAIYWTKEEVIKHASQYSKSFNNKSSAWGTNFDAMAKKTLLRALFGKYAPMTVDFQRVLTFDESENIDMGSLDHVPATPSTPPPEKKTAPTPDSMPPPPKQSKTVELGEWAETLKQRLGTNRFKTVIDSLIGNGTYSYDELIKIIDNNDEKKAADACDAMDDLMEAKNG